MNNNNPSANSGSALRYGMFIPLALMLASVITCCFSYSNAKQNIANDLNDAMFALANENSELWTRPNTVAAIRQMYETTHKPLIYEASDVNFRNTSLKEEAYFTLDGIKLTPMQRQFAQMLLDAPDMKVDKRTLCQTLWDNKSNAEESLYTLVRRTKTALAKANMEIICNRGDSYELRITG